MIRKKWYETLEEEEKQFDKKTDWSGIAEKGENEMIMQKRNEIERSAGIQKLSGLTAALSRWTLRAWIIRSDSITVCFWVPTGLWFCFEDLFNKEVCCILDVYVVLSGSLEPLDNTIISAVLVQLSWIDCIFN